jgi:prepilin-type N-terminal cleavage/methylation domain-containing protein
LFGHAGYAMKKIAAHRLANQQRGFTLLELLITLLLVLILLVSAQRYIAGVTVDMEGLQSRHEQLAQTRIVLSNMQRDVAQAGFYPYSEFEPTTLDLGVTYTNGRLVVRSFQPFERAYDCNSDRKQYREKNVVMLEQTDSAALPSARSTWVLVQNSYELVRTTKEDTLKCDGNGGDVDRQPLVSNVIEMRVTDAKGNIPAEGSKLNFVSVCLVSQESRTTIGSETSTMCDGKPVPILADARYYKIRVDMPVYTASFGAGQ